MQDLHGLAGSLTLSSDSVLTLVHGPDRLCDVGVRSHVHLHAMRQADGRVPHLSPICCQVFLTRSITTSPHATPRLQSCQDFQGLSWDCGRSVSSSRISYSRIFSDSFLSRSTFKPVPMSRLQNYSPNTRRKYILAYGHTSHFSVLSVMFTANSGHNPKDICSKPERLIKCLLWISNQVS